jgi:hypothetical protein
VSQGYRARVGGGPLGHAPQCAIRVEEYLLEGQIAAAIRRSWSACEFIRIQDVPRTCSGRLAGAEGSED